MHEPNELSIDLLSTSGLNPWDGNDSSARKVMANTHVGQAPWIVGSETRRFFTGAEFEYGKYTFDVSFPADCQVIHIFDKYKCGIGEGAIAHNPTRYVIYEELTSERRLGVLVLPEFKSYHKDFGFPLKVRPSAEAKLRQINDPNYPPYFEENEVIAASPAVKENGEYGIGVNASVVALSLPSTIEDGFMVSREFLKKLGSKGYHKCVADFGKRYILVNLYGDENNYKPFPDIGDRIRPDGMVFALREIDASESMMEMTPKALMRLDAGHDKPVFGEPNGRVADITVWHDEHGRKKSHPTGLDAQARKYYEAGKAFHEDIMRLYHRKFYERNKNLRLTYELGQLVYEAQVYLPEREPKKTVVRSHKLDRLDEWRVEITYEYDIDPTTGYKMTDIHGGKGVVCYITDRENMPRDANGNYADVAFYGMSSIRRMNMGRPHEQLCNAASRDLVQRMRRAEKLDAFNPDIDQINLIVQDPNKVAKYMADILGFYKIVSPMMYDRMLKCDYKQHVWHVFAEGIYVWAPPNNPVNWVTVGLDLVNSKYRPTYGPVEFTNTIGQRVKTVLPVLIGDFYMILLEKTTDEWSAAASVRQQHLGMPAKLNNSDKYSTYGRSQSVRCNGEAENRNQNANASPEGVSALMELSNNPLAHRALLMSLYESEHPTNIDRGVDRSVVPFHNARPNMLFRNMMACFGIEFTKVPSGA